MRADHKPGQEIQHCCTLPFVNQANSQKSLAGLANSRREDSSTRPLRVAAPESGRSSSRIPPSGAGQRALRQWGLSPCGERGELGSKEKLRWSVEPNRTASGALRPLSAVSVLARAFSRSRRLCRVDIQWVVDCGCQCSADSETRKRSWKRGAGIKGGGSLPARRPLPAG